MIVKEESLEFRPLPGRRAADPFEGHDITDVSTRVVLIDASSRRSPHRHPHSYEVMYVVSGSGHLWERGVFQRVEPGDCIAIPPGVPHATVPDVGTRMQLVCFFPRHDLGANTEELDDPRDLRALMDEAT